MVASLIKDHYHNALSPVTSTPKLTSQHIMPVCQQCRGDGVIPIACTFCSGRGQIPFDTFVNCAGCSGQGYPGCRNCRGRGQVTERKWETCQACNGCRTTQCQPCSCTTSWSPSSSRRYDISCFNFVPSQADSNCIDSGSW
ncbi:hypothetical protein FA13DRAFT_284877 [Coprinellus micaceus]|uniref:CR-type domain-containing protein n=1 Tax=Coprinellus micaceus TaxID=71717 RepID=A0A4Y7TDP0_COPMI|nr:hypothetical protein FA13DRAFT_284877 [Coprinellus micaceus]